MSCATKCHTNYGRKFAATNDANMAREKNAERIDSLLDIRLEHEMGSDENRSNIRFGRTAHTNTYQ